MLSARALLLLLPACCWARAAEVSRLDLANAYLRFDGALAAHPATGKRLGEIGHDFDAATLAFFAGRNDDALRAIDAQTLRLLTDDQATEADRAALSLHVAIDPGTWAITMNRAPVVRCYPLYPLAAGEAPPQKLRLQIEPLDSQDPPLEIEIPWPTHATAETPAQTDIREVGAFGPGMYELRLQAGSGPMLFMGRFRVAPEPLSMVRQAYADRLAKIKPDGAESAEALAICQARNELLTDQPDEKVSAQLLADPVKLIPALASEIEALESGRDPYRRREGDYWRTLATSKAPIPLRVYAPRAACGDVPGPVVIALHGAGGDENMFFDAYGAGVLKRLADERGFLAVTPSTYGFGGKPENLTALLDSLANHYAIDRQRVYLLGHSMGAAAAATLAREAPEQVTVACCLAGGATFSADDHPAPILIIAAENDQVIPAARLKPGAEKAIAWGLPVEFRVAPDHGHTTIVGALTSEGVDWLLARRR